MDVHPPSSRPASAQSDSRSAYSHAGSTRHILADFDGGSLDPPNVPFAGSLGSARSRGSNVSSAVSLTVNYIPSKFSATLLSPGGSATRKRKGGAIDPDIPKRGGGLDAFRSGEARMGGMNDEDYGFGPGVGSGGTKKRLRWNKFKWILFFANILLTAYSLVALIFCLLTWFNVWAHADIARVGNHTELVISTLAASIGLITAVFGWAGILLNNRSFLAIWTFSLWITFIFLLVPGYLTYKQRTFNLEGKINAQWSRALGTAGRLRIQDQLACCGYYSPFVEATVSETCYARSVLPGCKQSYIKWQHLILGRWFTIAFALVPVHIGVILAGLLCSNHVTYRFGKGMMPKAYRLSMTSMAVIMDNYANQLAEQYGDEVASRVLTKSRSRLNLNSMEPMPYAKPSYGTPGVYHGKYDSIDSRAPDGTI